MRYQPNIAIRRMKEIAELQALHTKRCKNPSETSLVLLEVDRRKRLIEQIGGQAPSNDTLVGVLWSTMDSGTKTHVSGRITDVSEVGYAELKTAIMKHASLMEATTTKAPNAKDIGAIGSYPENADAASSPQSAASHEDSDSPKSSQIWSLDATGWPVDE